MNDLPTNLPPFLVLVALLNAVGRGLKKSRVDDEWIPFLLCALGAICLGFLKGFDEANLSSGVVAGLTAVGGNQALRQGLQLFWRDVPPAPPTSTQDPPKQ